MNVLDRMIEIRKYRRLTQADVAEWFGLSKQGYQKKESGKIIGINPSDLEIFLKKTNIDARYLFGQIDDIEEADLSKQKKKPADYTDLVNEINTLKDKVTSVKEKDPVAYRVSINNPLRNIAEKLQFLDAALLEKIDAMILGYLSSLSENQNKKESAAG